jgi:hypothetical protein
VLITFRVPSEQHDPTAYLKDCIITLANYLVDEVPDKDLVGLKIRNTENMLDTFVGISMRHRDQFKTAVVRDIFGNFIQSNAMLF